MLKRVVWSLICSFAGAAVGILLTAWGLGGWPFRPPPVSSSSTPSVPTIEQVRSLSELVTTSVDVADVQLTDLRGWTGGIRVALLVRGRYLIGTNLNEARFASIDAVSRSAVLVLPPPRATAPHLDHPRTKLFALSPYGVWQVVPSNRAEVTAVNRALAEGQASIADAAADGTQVEAARRQAESVVGSFAHAIGWDVAVRWSDRP